ncbi:hypothetical protein JCM10213_008438 [Rhodosporidiobolus nylandii]
MLRTLSFAGLVALLAALFAATPANALMSQGNLDFSRDSVISYNTAYYADTETFCKAFRSACVTYVGPIGQYGSHHQLDCVFQKPDGEKVQEGNRIHAFCGALAKNPDGTWTNGGKVTDYTAPLIKKSFRHKATVKSGPMTVAACKKFAKTHPDVVCSSPSQ